MIVIMSNFIPMLSSSPPPIDDIDSPENDDDDDGFGTFATANNAFDCSFDSPTFPKSTKSNGDSCLSKNFENEAAVKIENENSLSVDFVTQSETEYQNPLPENIDIKTDIVCENGIPKEDIDVETVSSSVYLTENLNNVTTISYPIVNTEKCSPASNESSQKNVCNNDNIGSSGDASLSLTVESKITGDIEELDYKTVCKLSDDCNLSDEGVILQESLTNLDRMSDNLSNVLPSAERLSPNSGYSDEKENAVLDSSSESSPNQMLHSKTCSISDVPDLTFIPFTDLEPFEEEANHFADFRNADHCTDIQNKHTDEVHKDKLNGEAGTCNGFNSDDEEFGNFETVKPAAVYSENMGAQNEDESFDEFADFSSSQFISENLPDTATSLNFADFESSEAQLKTSISPPKEHLKGADKIFTIINVVFPLSEESASENLSENHNQVLDQNCKSRRLWERLHETEHLPGVPFQWGVSHSFQQLLRSVNVDYHSILRTSTVPFFASGLGLLEPTKSAMAATESRKSSQDLQDFEDPIPAVQFDWDSSGLVNPLDCSQAISTLMDLTFLNNSTPQCDAATDFSFETELLTNQVTISPVSCQKAPIVEHILSLGAKTSVVDLNSGSRPSSLSQETIHVLKQLPNLSYMRAQMLMFPISSDNSYF